jgi:hypothetical protein
MTRIPVRVGSPSFAEMAAFGAAARPNVGLT